MGRPLRLLAAGPPPLRDEVRPAARRADDENREQLLELLAQQQRVAQAGLVTAGLAHDINNHLTVLSGTSFLALQSPKPDDWREALERVQEVCLEMTEVTRSFLDFVKRRDAVQERSFRLGDVASQAVRLMQPLARKRSVSLSHRVEMEGEVAGDPRLIVQALVNLVSNAIRACASGEGEVSIVAGRTSSGKCRLTVLDNGGGIPEELRSRLFRPFATGHPDRGGHGLGLFIVRQTVRRMDGTIRVRSSAEGTAFTIDLPAAG